MISRAASYLMLKGPATAQDRWEENAGYSPYTVATVIAGLSRRGDRQRTAAKRVPQISCWNMPTGWRPIWRNGWSQPEASWLKASPVITSGSIPLIRSSRSASRTRIRTMIPVANGGGLYPARNVVGGDFLHLVRLGIRESKRSNHARLDQSH